MKITLLVTLYSRVGRTASDVPKTFPRGGLKTTQHTEQNRGNPMRLHQRFVSRVSLLMFASRLRILGEEAVEHLGMLVKEILFAFGAKIQILSLVTRRDGSISLHKT